MTDIKKFIIIVHLTLLLMVFVITVLYLGFAFMNWNYDPGTWSDDCRFCLWLASTVVCAGGLSYLLCEFKERKILK